MKNLVQGQEISKYSYSVLQKSMSQGDGDLFGCFAGTLLILIFLAYFVGLPILGLGLLDKLIIEFNLSLTFPFQLVPLFSYLVLVVIFWRLSYKKLIKNKSFNPSVVYYDDCLLVLHNPDEDGFKGEIPFKKIRRVVLLNQNIIQLIVEENFFPISKNIDKQEFYFQLHPDLREIGLQIVDELNSKVR
jgi:hypothetical protein